MLSPRHRAHLWHFTPMISRLTLFALCFSSTLVLGQTPAAEEKPKVDPAAAAKRIKDLGNNDYELGGIRFNSATREIRIPCAVNMQQGQIEFALVHETGKTHESILKTSISPVDMQVALLLCSYEPGHNGLFDHEKDPTVKKNLEETQTKTPGANKVQLFVETGKDAEKKRVQIRDWIKDNTTEKAPTDFDHWIFNGSMVQESGFSAALHGNLVGIYYDVAAILNCPTPRNRNDEAWFVMEDLVPAVDSPVTLIIAPTK
ncbi:MAG: hypothetical protein JNJ83_04785 [Verrucomicrobiaceae bacterium]|nr:hypothetical protein [Verrucomicrobiaceae bacterium]